MENNFNNFFVNSGNALFNGSYWNNIQNCKNTMYADLKAKDEIVDIVHNLKLKKIGWLC